MDTLQSFLKGGANDAAAAASQASGAAESLGAKVASSVPPVASAAVTPRSGYHLFGALYFEPKEYQREGIFIGIALVYVLVWFVARQRNRNRAYAWTRAALPDLEEEFAVVATENPYGKGPLLWNGAGDAVLFATGRRSVDSLSVTFHFYPYHDPITILGSAFLSTVAAGATVGATQNDFTHMEITVTLPKHNDNLLGVFALVDKSALRRTKTKDRFDLTFTRLNETDNAASQRSLDNQWAILSESGDLTDLWLGEINDKGAAQRARIGLQNALNGPTGKWVDSIVIRDQPKDIPVGPLPSDDRPRQIVLTMRVPGSQAEAKETLPLLSLALNLADMIVASQSSATSGATGQPTDSVPARLKQDTLAKLRKTRAEVDKRLDEVLNKEAREAEAEAKADAKAKAEKAKFDKLSPAEQEKRREVERKRQQKKSMKTMKR